MRMLRRLQRSFSKTRKTSVASVSTDSFASESSNPDMGHNPKLSGSDVDDALKPGYQSTTAHQQPQPAQTPLRQSCAPSPQPSRDAVTGEHGTDSASTSREVSSPASSAWRAAESSEGLQRFTILQEIGRHDTAGCVGSGLEASSASCQLSAGAVTKAEACFR